jgi:hypothetical protein
MAMDQNTANNLENDRQRRTSTLPSPSSSSSSFHHTRSPSLFNVGVVAGKGARCFRRVSFGSVDVVLFHNTSEERSCRLCSHLPTFDFNVEDALKDGLYKILFDFMPRIDIFPWESLRDECRDFTRVVDGISSVPRE